MPTLYTALRARHRHKIHVPSRPAPTPSPRALASVERAVAMAAPRKKPSRRVVVIGGGLAGLCAAYELQQYGYRVAVYEARDRVGGRVWSFTGDRNDPERFIPGKTVEGGAELIGGNHPLWLAYKDRFGLTFTDVEDYGNSPIRIGKHTLTFDESSTLTDQVEKELKALTELAETVVDPFEPWTTPDAAKLDGVSVGQWLTKAECSRRCKRAIAQQLASDNGVPADQQSLLGVLAMIKGGGLDRYWTDTELYRCEGGNSQLAEKFRDALNAESQCVFDSAPVRRIVRTGRRAICFVERDGALEQVWANDVILAIPPSVWSGIRVSDRRLAALLRRAPAMGHTVKYLMRFDRRFWQDFNSGPTLTEDGPVDLTWETTEAERDPDYAMVAFSGAADADTCRSWSDDRRRTNYVKALGSVYPGIGGQLRDERFMNWPDLEWSKASYYFPRLNEIVTLGPLWKAGHGDWFHFAGEHTCYAFVGYMEGALASGYRLARRLAVRDQLVPA